MWMKNAAASASPSRVSRKSENFNVGAGVPDGPPTLRFRRNIPVFAAPRRRVVREADPYDYKRSKGRTHTGAALLHFIYRLMDFSAANPWG